MSPQLLSVSAAGREAVALKGQPWRVGEEHWFNEVERARAQFAQVIHASADDVAFAPSASYGIATAARNCPVEAGQTIVLLAEQFPSCVYPWQRKAADSGATIVTVPRTDGEAFTPAVLEAIDEACAVVALPAFHWADGARLDLEAIGRAARRVGASFVLDLSQSVGAAPLDLSAVDPDWLCAPTYKWLLGPYSTGFLYVAPRNHDGIPLEENWIARAGSEDFSKLVDYQDEYRAGARRYDVGERSNFVLMPMVNAALEQLLEWGVERISETLRATTRELEQIAAEHGFEAAPEAERAPHILGLNRAGGLPEGLVAKLRERSVIVGARGETLRVSPYLHVEGGDLERFRDALGAAL
jgi:selenocysteine lyase/cysteine desulfurase